MSNILAILSIIPNFRIHTNRVILFGIVIVIQKYHTLPPVAQKFSFAEISIKAKTARKYHSLFPHWLTQYLFYNPRELLMKHFLSFDGEKSQRYDLVKLSIVFVFVLKLD